MARGKEKTQVTARLSMRERKTFVNVIEALTARHRLAHRCPLPAEDLVALWRATMSPIDLNFWAAAYAKAQNGSELCFIEPAFQGVILDFDFGRVVLQIPQKTFKSGRLPLWDRRGEMAPVDPAPALGIEKTLELRNWAELAIHIHTRTCQTRRTLHDILDMSSTIGQLNRMAPELVQYANEKTQQALSEQERRSPLPEAWMQVDRMLVRSSLDHLTFCYLLPKIEDSEEDANDSPWCWDGPGVTTAANWYVRPEVAASKCLSTYMPPFDPNPMELGKFVGGK